MTAEILIEAGDDHPYAGVGQVVEQLSPGRRRRTGLRRCRPPARQNAASRSSSRLSATESAASSRLSRVTSLSPSWRVSVDRLEDLHPLAGDDRAPHAPDQLFALAGEHASGDDLYMTCRSLFHGVPLKCGGHRIRCRQRRALADRSTVRPASDSTTRSAPASSAMRGRSGRHRPSTDRRPPPPPSPPAESSMATTSWGWMRRDGGGGKRVQVFETSPIALGIRFAFTATSSAVTRVLKQGLSTPSCSRAPSTSPRSAPRDQSEHQSGGVRRFRDQLRGAGEDRKGSAG